MQQAQQSQSLLLQRAADLQRAQAALTSARQQVAVLRTAEAEAKRPSSTPQAVEQQGRLNLSYATITARRTAPSAPAPFASASMCRRARS